VEPHRLATVDVEPGEQEVPAEQRDPGPVAQGAEKPFEAAGVDLLAGFVEVEDAHHLVVGRALAVGSLVLTVALAHGVLHWDGVGSVGRAAESGWALRRRARCQSWRERLYT